MTSITIGSLDAAAADELRIRALANDCTLEEEARNILCFALTNWEILPPPKKLGTAIHERFKRHGGEGLTLPTREKVHEPPMFD